MIPLFVKCGTQNCEVRLEEQSTIASLKSRLYTITGVEPAFMKLQIVNKRSNLTSLIIDNDHDLLSDYGICPFDTLMVLSLSPSSHVIDSCYSSNDVPKYEISDEKYMSRQDNAAKWKETMKVFVKKENKTKEVASFHEDTIHVNDRVLVKPSLKAGDSSFIEKKGTVRYVGSVHFAKGVWIGIELDDPLGKHDGSLDNISYFECKENHGSFVKPELVHVILSSNEMKEDSLSDIEEL